MSERQDIELVSVTEPVTVENVVEQIKKRTSLETVLACEPVRNLANDNGEFSPAKQAIIATVVSVMQDEIIGLVKEQVEALKQELREQRSFVTRVVGNTTAALVMGLRSGWTTPLITTNPSAPDDSKSSGFLGDVKALFNWGNFTTLAAVVLLCVAIYYTKAYDSLKDRVENQSKYVKELQEQNDKKEGQIKSLEKTHQDLQKQLSDAQSQDAIDKARYDTVSRELQVQNGSATDLQSQLASANAKISELSASSAANGALANSANNDSATYKKLWEQEKTARREADANAKALNTENQKLALEIQRFKAKH